MNNFLLRGLLSATVCLVAGSAFAQTTETATIGVSNDVTLSSGDANKAFPTNKDIELYTLYTDGTITKIGRASCREKCRSRWSPYH